MSVAHTRLNPFGCPFYRVVTDGIRRKSVSEFARPESVEGIVIDYPVDRHANGIGEVSAHTDIGSRKCQEDRMLYCPSLGGREDCLLLAIFDGTVGDFASNTMKDILLPHLLASQSWARLRSTLEQSPSVATELFPLIAETLDNVCCSADRELLRRCEVAIENYSASTGVIALLVGGCCAIAHVGDSRAALSHYGGYMTDVTGNFLTDDHKPHQLYERARIKQFGGSVEYLHNHSNRAFLRGGDFMTRKSRGEQPMQLQYSRAFGGKDLKLFGLSSDPDIICFRIEPWHSSLLLGSDGLWDVLVASHASHLVYAARRQDVNPAAALVEAALREQQAQRQPSDNITAMVLFFNTEFNGHLQIREKTDTVEN